MPSVSIRSYSKCFLSSSGNRGLFSDGERDLDLQKQKLNYKFKQIDARFVLVWNTGYACTSFTLLLKVITLKVNIVIMFKLDNKL
jgi:hypothetical protein